ncbi:hypothetical protein HG430_004310 [Candidatus Gracilibacteria bacterium]|nr:hypothetical protein [Candidatus Gracilibacteria bacterium]
MTGSYTENLQNRANEVNKENKERIDFLKNKYENPKSNSFLYKKYPSIIDKYTKLLPSLDNEEKNKGNQILKDLEKLEREAEESGTEADIRIISDFMKQLENIVNNYEESAGNVSESTKQEISQVRKDSALNDTTKEIKETGVSEWEKDGKLPDFSQYIIQSESSSGLTTAPGAPESEVTTLVQPEQKKDKIKISKILDVNFNGNYSKENAQKLLNKIENGEIGGLTEKDENGDIKLTEAGEVIKYQLEQLIDNLEDQDDAKEVGMARVEDYFNGLGKSIKKVGDKYYIPLKGPNGEDYSLAFDSEEEAVNKVLELKKGAETILQGMFQNLFEAAGNKFVSVLEGTLGLALTGVTISYEWLWKTEKWSFGHLKNSWGEIIDNFKNNDNNHTILEWLYALSSLAVFWSFFSVFVGTHSAMFESLTRRIIGDFINASNKDYSKNSQYVYQDLYSKGDQFAQAISNMNGKELEDATEFRERQTIIENIKLYRDLQPFGSEEFTKYDKILKKLEKYKLNKTDTFYYLLDLKVLSNGKIGSLKSGLTSFFVRGGHFPIFPFKGNGEKWSRIKVYRLSNWYTRNPVKTPNFKKETIDLFDDKISDALVDMQKIYKKEIVVEPIADSFKFKIKFKDGGLVKLENLLDTDYYSGVYDYIKGLNLADKAEELRRIESLNKYFKDLVDTPKSKQIIYSELYKIKEGYLLDDEALKEVNKAIKDLLKQMRIRDSYQGIGIRGKGGNLYRLRYLKKMIEDRKVILRPGDIEAVKNGRKISSIPKLKDIINISNIEEEFDKQGGILEKGKVVADNMDKIKKDYGIKVDDIKLENAKKNGTKYGVIDEFKEKDFGKGLLGYIDYMLVGKEETEARDALEKILKDIQEGKILFSNEDEFLRYIHDKVPHIANGNTFDPNFKTTFESNKVLVDHDFIDNLKLNSQHNSLQNPASIRNLFETSYSEELSLMKVYKKTIDEITNANNSNGELKKFNDGLDKFIGKWGKNRYTKGQAMYILEELFKGKEFDSIDYINNTTDHSKANVADIVRIKNDLKTMLEGITDNKKNIIKNFAKGIKLEDKIFEEIFEPNKAILSELNDLLKNIPDTQKDINVLEKQLDDYKTKYAHGDQEIKDKLKEIEDLINARKSSTPSSTPNSSPNNAPNRGPGAGLDKKEIRKYREEIIPYLRQIEAQLIINLYDSKDAREVSLALDKYETYTNNQISLISKNNIEELHSILENITDINLRRRTILNFLTEKMYPGSNFNVLDKTKLETKINGIKNSGIRIKIHGIEGGGKFKIKDIFEHTKTKFKF